MDRTAICTLTVTALAALLTAPIPAHAQFHPDRMTLCQDLAANAAMYRGRINRGATAAEIRSQVQQMPADQAARSMWSPATLLGAIDIAARHGADLIILQQRVQAACEAQNPDGRQTTVGLLRRYCGDLSNRAYAVALSRDSGMTRQQAEAEAFTNTRPQFRSDAAVVVEMAYAEPRVPAPQLGLAVQARCSRQPEISLR